MSDESTARTLAVSLVVCLSCSLAVAASTVILRPYHRAHERAARAAGVMDVLARQPGLSELIGDVDDISLDQAVVNLATGEPAPHLDPSVFDAQRAASDPATSLALPPERDLARIQRRASHAVVTTVVSREGAPKVLLLPIYGKGYAGVIHGTLALAPDGNTILGLAIHDHKETPGIGTQIEDADWRAEWSGKKARDEQDRIRIRVGVDEPAPSPADAPYFVEGISGATRSSVGVGDMIRFWLGDDGFGPFLTSYRGEGTP